MHLWRFSLKVHKDRPQYTLLILSRSDISVYCKKRTRHIPSQTVFHNELSLAMIFCLVAVCGQMDKE